VVQEVLGLLDRQTSSLERLDPEDRPDVLQELVLCHHGVLGLGVGNPGPQSHILLPNSQLSEQHHGVGLDHRLPIEIGIDHPLHRGVEVVLHVGQAVHPLVKPVDKLSEHVVVTW